LTDVDTARVREIDGQLKARRGNPRDVKLELAEVVVGMYHSADEARQAREEFLKVFSRREHPTQLLDVPVQADASGQVDVVALLVQEGLVKTKNEARRLLKQRAVKLNGQPITTHTVASSAAAGVLQVGSRKFRRLSLPAA
jgi:tyrosyl-tRNA synthetase